MSPSEDGGGDAGRGQGARRGWLDSEVATGVALRWLAEAESMARRATNLGERERALLEEALASARGMIQTSGVAAWPHVRAQLEPWLRRELAAALAPDRQAELREHAARWMQTAAGWASARARAEVERHFGDAPSSARDETGSDR